MIKDVIQKLVEKKDLTDGEAIEIMSEIMSGEAKPSQIASFLTALRMKGETVEEITAFAKVMRERSLRINPQVNGKMIDTCGTGGDKVKTFNISTCAAFVIAGAQVTVAKHGNKAVTSSCGSADLLENFGLKLDVEPRSVEEAVEKVGIGFLYAPAFHPAMKHATPVRREICIRTVFNILGPLVSPAQVSNQVLGVYTPDLVEPLSYVLRNLGSESAMVVHGLDGLDEVSTIGITRISHLQKGMVKVYELSPGDFGVKKADPTEVKSSTLEGNVETAFKILTGKLKKGAKRDAVLVNASVGLVVARKTDDFKDGMELGRESIDSGRAYNKLRELVHFHGNDVSKLEELERRFA